jgi:hypothetical protein
VHDERVKVIGEASGGGGVAALVELACERLEPVLGVAGADRVMRASDFLCKRCG